MDRTEAKKLIRKVSNVYVDFLGEHDAYFVGITKAAAYDLVDRISDSDLAAKFKYVPGTSSVYFG